MFKGGCSCVMDKVTIKDTLHKVKNLIDVCLIMEDGSFDTCRSEG